VAEAGGVSLTPVSLAAAERRDAQISYLFASVVPAVVIVAYSFRSGGYPPGLPATGAALLWSALALRALMAPRTLSSLPGPGVVLVLALAGLAAWTLLSITWSDTPAPAITDASRASFYLAAFVSFATQSRRTLPVVIKSCVAGITFVAIVALSTRLLPDIFPIVTATAQPRLSYPVGYQNAFGVLVAIGLILALHVATGAEERALVKVLATACVPTLATALYLSQSRGAIGTALVGLTVWTIAGRPRAALPAIAALVIPILAVVGMAYRSVELIGYQWNVGPAVEEGHRLALVLAVASVLAAVLRSRLRVLDDVALPRPARRTVLVAASCITASLLMVAIVTDVPAKVGATAASFKSDEPVEPVTDPRARLTQAFNGGRIDLWEVAGRAWRERPLTGQGAGTFEQSWHTHRPRAGELAEAHSLYFETLSELGVVGLALVVVSLVALAGCLLGARAGRSARAACLAVVIVWVIHAAVDWDWEMPVVTAPLFMLGGAACWRPRGDAMTRRAGTAVAVACLALCVIPASWAIGQAMQDRALDAYAAGDCSSATTWAQRATAVSPWRPDVEVVLGACLVRAGERRSAAEAARRAARLAPADWRYAYDAAMLLAAAGQDGWPEARRAAILSRYARESYWAVYWLRAESTQARRTTAALGPLMLAGDRYPPAVRTAAQGTA
jgi:O-antigen ligase